MRYKFFLLCLCFLHLVVVAQTTDKFHIQKYTTENGLPSNGIKGLQWDEKTGFLWIATEAGIVRFNGVEFRLFTKENTPSIESERMLFMTRNFKGKICISDMIGNIFNIQQDKPVLWSKAKDDANPYYDNYYLLSVADSFFNRHFKDSKINTKFSVVTDNIVSLNDTSCLIKNINTIYYQSISMNTAAVVPLKKDKFLSLFKIDEHCFVIDNKKTIFLINKNTYNHTTIVVKNEQNLPLNLAFKNANLFWESGMKNPVYVNGEKAWELSYTNNAIVARLICNSIPLDVYINSVQYSQKNKTLFIGTDSKGILIISENLVQSKKREVENSKNRNSYYAQIELPNGNILTNEGDVISDNRYNINKDNLPIKGKFSFYISYTIDSLLWFYQNNTKYAYQCMFSYNKATNKTKAFPQIKTASILTVSEGNTWLANIKGIYKLRGDSFEIKFVQPKEGNGNPLFAFTEIKTGILALASCKGLFSFNTSTLKYDTIFTSKDFCVRSIWKYKDYIFFGTYGGGFYVHKNGVVKPMPLDKNKYLLYTHCFVEDNNGFCWISTNRGLFKAKIEELLNAAENKATFVYYHYFGKKDGMEMTELNGGCTPCALMKQNNTISFPSMDGLLFVKPATANPVLPNGDIFIDEIIIDNVPKNYSLNKSILLPSTTTEVVFKLAYSAWCNIENIYIEYKLNENDSWKPLNPENGSAIRLSNLPTGKYMLQIRKVNGFGYNNYTKKQIDFEIITPWHKQWWFYFLAGFSFLGLLYFFYKRRTKALLHRQERLETLITQKTAELVKKNDVLEKSNNINTRLISIISHDIITPLKFLNVAGKKLVEKKAVLSEELKEETINEIATTSKELELLSTNILNWIKYQAENRLLVKEDLLVCDLVNNVFGILKSLANQKNILLINNISSTLKINEFYEPLKILMYNLITNAINFSDKGTILIEATTENKLQISVKDEGIGMSTDQINNIMNNEFIVSSANMDNKKGNGLGYLIIKDLIKMMSATLTIKSTRGKGTTVLVDLVSTVC